MVAAAVVVAIPLLLWRGNKGGPGTIIEAPVTLITADRDALECAYGHAVGKYRCAYSAPDIHWQDAPAPADTLTQYLTTDRRLILIAGLFQQPALAARYAKEPPTSVNTRRLKRFTARCQVRLLEKVHAFNTRWSKDGDWENNQDAWVAEPVDCTVED